MRRSSALVLGVLILALLAAAAVAYGSYKGFQAEKAQVESAMGSLDTVYSTRVETGYNILTVAGRYPAVDAGLVGAVRQDVEALKSPGQRLQKAEVSARFETNARALLKALEALPAVQADARDLGYVTRLLPQALDQSAQWADAGKYNEAAIAFNQRLSGTIPGRIAKMLGVTEAAVMSAGGRP